MTKIIARWESRGKAHFVVCREMTADNGKTFYGYDAPGHSGSLADESAESAIAEIQRRVDRRWFIPDASKATLKRVF